MRILCVFGQHNYGNPKRGEGYEYVNFIPTFGRLGHEVLFLESWNRTCYRNFEELNKALLDTVEQTQPDIIFTALFHYEIWLETWKILRDAGISAIINWTTDDSWRYSQFSRLVAPAFHAFTTTYPTAYARYQHDGIPHVLLTQWAANVTSLQPPLPADKCQFPVSFIGTAHGNRKASIYALKRKGIEVTCFGYGWPNGPIDAREIPHIIRNSVISLNFGNSVLGWNGIRLQRTKQIKARTFEVPGAGGFLLTEWVEGLDHYYTPGKEIATFNNLDELKGLIYYYLAHKDERDAMAQAGYEHTRMEHTYDQRLAAVLDFALRQREKYYAQRTVTPSGQIDWHRFEAAAQRHLPNQKLMLLKRIMVAFCSILWGPLRGPRAARRLMFEISWRVAGAHTYSSRGWVGRMFYEVS